jgi:tripartite-type tricarboxylate transporter receptor subunit TctC
MEGLMRITRRHLIAASAALLAARSAGAQGAWPNRIVRLISSSPPAGASDILTRTLGQALQEQTGRSFLIENKAGAAGVIGSDYVAKAAPDGYTWLTANVGPQAINQTLLPTQPFDSRKDFRYVTIIGRLPIVMLVNNDVPAKTLAEFVALAKSKPGGLNFGSGGNGTLLHLTGELLKIAAGINMQHVPYRGAQAATQDLMGGRLEAMFDSLPSAAPHIRSGTVRALAVSTDKRSPSFPDIPTIAEQGYPSVVTTNWFAFAGPAGVPDEIIARMYTECVKALKSSSVIERLANIGVEPGGDPPDATQAFVLAEVDRWAKVVTETGTKMN